MPLFKSNKTRTDSVKVLPTKEELKEDDTSSQHSWSFSEEHDHASPDPAEKNKLMAKDPRMWTVAEVGQWLGIIGLGQYRIPFIENAISGEDLMELAEEDLVNSLQIVRLGDRKKILRGIRILNGGGKLEIKSLDSLSQGSWSNASKSFTGGTDTQSDTSSHASDDDRFDLSKSISVKIYFKDDIRSYDMDHLTYEKLYTFIKKEYGSDISLKYQDSEGELVTLTNDNDIKRGYKSGTLKIHIKGGKAHLNENETKTLDNLSDPIVISDKKGKILFFNKSAEKMFGFTKDQVKHKSVKILMNKHDAKRHKKYMKNYIKTGIAQVIGKGRIVDCRNSEKQRFKARLTVSETVDEGFHYFTATLSPITEDKAATPATSLLQQCQILDSLMDVAVVIDDDGIVQFFNGAGEKFFGWKRTEVVGKNVKMLMPEPFRSEHDVYLSNYKRSKIARLIGTEREVPVQLKDGRIVSCAIKLTEQDRSNRLFFTGVFVPSQKKQEEKKETVLELERNMINSLLLAAIVIDIHGTIQAFNVPASKLLGYELSEMVGKSMNAIVPPGDERDKHDGYIKRYMETRKSKIIGLGRKIKVAKKSGEIIVCKLWLSEKMSENKVPFFTGILEPVE